MVSDVLCDYAVIYRSALEFNFLCLTQLKTINVLYFNKVLKLFYIILCKD